MTLSLFILLVLGLGFLCGLRTFTPLAVTTIAIHVGSIRLRGTPLAFLGTMAAHLIIVLLALVEIVLDKLPFTPSRLRPAGLIGRVLFGAVTGIAFAFTYHHSTILAAVLGMIGAPIGAYAGNKTRARLVQMLKSPDWPIALLEDAICILSSFLILTHSW